MHFDKLRNGQSHAWRILQQQQDPHPPLPHSAHREARNSALYHPNASATDNSAPQVHDSEPETSCTTAQAYVSSSAVCDNYPALIIRRTALLIQISIPLHRRRRRHGFLLHL
jgi:hypothetical protein